MALDSIYAKADSLESVYHIYSAKKIMCTTIPARSLLQTRPNILRDQPTLSVPI